MRLKEIPFIRKAAFLWRNWLSRRSYAFGSGNKVVNNGGVKVHSPIQINGNGNRVVLEKGSLLHNTTVKIQGNNNEVVLKAGAYVSGAELWVEDNGSRIVIGERSFIGDHSHLACTEGSSITIGEDCMISSYVQVRTGDSHSILDAGGKRINQAQPVCIGPHCWIGEGTKVLKGVMLEGDCVVATGAIVTHSFGKNLLLCGIPAVVQKENVNWDKNRLK